MNLCRYNTNKSCENHGTSSRTCLDCVFDTIQAEIMRRERKKQMKFVIEIPEEAYKARQRWVANPKRKIDEVDKAIANGKPLDDVLDEVRAEITHKHLSINEKSEFDNGRTYAYEEVIDIIDKYKAEK